MQRYAVVLILLLVAVALVTGVFANIRKVPAMEVRFNTRALPEHGIQIITPADPSFEETSANYLQTLGGFHA